LANVKSAKRQARSFAIAALKLVTNLFCSAIPATIYQQARSAHTINLKCATPRWLVKFSLSVL
jgi:hypothetical protein